MVRHYWGCQVCTQCRAGWPQLCERMPPRIASVNEHGAHADFMVVPASQVLPLPSGVGFRAGAAIGCAFGTAFGALERVGGVEGKSVLVLGQGPVGLSVTILATALGARVITSDLSRQRLDRSLQLGAHAAVSADTGDFGAAVNESTAGRGPEVVVETSGSSAAAGLGLDILPAWGTLCAIGVGADIRFNTRDTLTRPMTLVTSWTMSTVQQLRCARLVDERSLPVDELFSRSWTLEDGAAAYEWFGEQAEGKGVFEPSTRQP